MRGDFYKVTEAWLNHFTDESLRARDYAVGAGIYTLCGVSRCRAVAAATAYEASLMEFVKFDRIGPATVH